MEKWTVARPPLLLTIFKSCCGVSVRIAMLYIAILSIITGALINAALKKAGVAIASIQAVKDLSEQGDSLYGVSTDTDEDVGFSEHSDFGGALRANKTANATAIATANKTAVETDAESNESELDSFTTTTTTTRTTTTGTTLSFMQKVSSVNRNGMNLLASAFVCLGVLLLVANFLKSPELALISVAASVAIAVSSLVLLAGVVGECAKKMDTCLLKKLDWFSSFIVTLFWFMYVFLWLFFAGVTNAFANGLY